MFTVLSRGIREACGHPGLVVEMDFRRWEVNARACGYGYSRGGCRCWDDPIRLWRCTLGFSYVGLVSCLLVYPEVIWLLIVQMKQSLVRDVGVTTMDIKIDFET